MNKQVSDIHSNQSASNLTRSQQLIWTGQLLSPDAPLYNMALAFEISGKLDTDIFTNAFNQLVNEFDSLRTIIISENNIPNQTVLDRLEYDIELVDFQYAETSDVDAFLNQRSKKLFDTGQPMFDSVLLKLKDQRHIWYLNQHHLTTDGWSVTIVYKRLAQLYDDLVSGKPGNFEVPAYSSYIKYEKQSRLEIEDGSKIRQYWENKSNSLFPPPVLYGTKSAGSSSDSERLTLELSPDRISALKALTKEPEIRAWTEHLSLFNIFATTLLAYLYRVSGQDNLAIGTPAHNRPTPEFKQTAGLFIELFPLAVNLDEGESFLSLFKKVQLESFDFLKYALPGASSPELSRGFNVVLNYINASFDDFNGLQMNSTWIHPDHADPAHLLRLQVHDFDKSGSIKLHFDLNSTVFSEAIRREIPFHFLNILDAFIEDRSSLIVEPTLVEGLEVYNQLKLESDNGDQPNVVELFEAIAADQPENIALSCANTIVDYGKLNSKANQLARSLINKEFGKGKRAAIYLKRSPELVISILAVLKSGGTYIPIDVNNSSGRISDILQDADLSFVITDHVLHKKLDTTYNDKVIIAEEELHNIADHNDSNIGSTFNLFDIAYIMYTSGSTGTPKGVMIRHSSLSNYITWAAEAYEIDSASTIPLFTATGFDLTITSLFLPLITGARLNIYSESEAESDLSVIDVFKDNSSSFIKLTPSHLRLLDNMDLSDSRVTTMVVGGEDFQASLANEIFTRMGGNVSIYNEYGPTEATVGCIIHKFDTNLSYNTSVSIGKAITGVTAHVFDEQMNIVPHGVAGELYISGPALAAGYWKSDELNKLSFINKPGSDEVHYKTGDLVRQNQHGDLEFLGRFDEQTKLGGRRVELGEIENAISKFEGIDQSVVEVRDRMINRVGEVTNCVKCGLPSNFPNADFNDQNVCSLCVSYTAYDSRVKQYFKDLTHLKSLFKDSLSKQDRKYDCIALLSGGKDSTYSVAKLVEMGLRVLAFTLDNGYISDQAKANIDRVVAELGIDHIYGSTPSMNAIFVDSLERHCNVCDGCFKTIYTLSFKIALEKDIPFIVTGLSRGQFFETRLTEELFNSDKTDIAQIDKVILNARKAYHRVDDAVKKHLDVSQFENDEVFEKVQFLDFYRFTDVSLDEMLEYLDERLPWKRPTDTGRSTNCLINQAGIFVHKKEKGYSNYAFPYSWDVRLGHKTRDASLDEINEEIDEPEVKRMLEEIGYKDSAKESEENQLVAYYKSDSEIDQGDMVNHLNVLLPSYMVPVQYIRVDEIPLTENGKIDKSALPVPDSIRPIIDTGYVAPRSDIEEILVEIWSEVLGIEKIGVYDKFIELGGNSLAAIRTVSRASEAFELDLSPNLAFNKPTIAAFAEYVRETIMQLLEEMEEE